MPCFAAGENNQHDVAGACASGCCQPSLLAACFDSTRRPLETGTNTVPPNPSTGEPQGYTAPCNRQASGPNTCQVTSRRQSTTQRCQTSVCTQSTQPLTRAIPTHTNTSHTAGCGSSYGLAALQLPAAGAEILCCTLSQLSVHTARLPAVHFSLAKRSRRAWPQQQRQQRGVSTIPATRCHVMMPMRRQWMTKLQQNYTESSTQGICRQPPNNPRPSHLPNTLATHSSPPLTSHHP